MQLNRVGLLAVQTILSVIPAAPSRSVGSDLNFDCTSAGPIKFMGSDNILGLETDNVVG